MIFPRPKVHLVWGGCGASTRRLLGLCVLLCLFLSPAPARATAKLTVNPVGEWFPVVTKFEFDESEAVGSGGDPGPFATKIKSATPGIPSAWRELEEMVRVRSAPRPTDPVISGWRPWYTPEGLSGIEIKAADPGTSSYVISFPRGRDRKVRWEVQVWGRYRLKDPDDPEKKRVLRPPDPKFQKLIKEKIEVVDFSLTAHRVQPDGEKKNIRNAAIEEPYQTVGRYQSGLGGASLSLARYEAQDYLVRMRGNFVGELRLRLTVRFPEAEKAQASAYSLPVEASLRFSSGDWPRTPRVISDKVRRVEPDQQKK